MRLARGIHLVLLLVTVFVCKADALLSEEEEREVLAEFKPIAEEIVTETFMKQDVYLLRWLRAFHHDIDETLEKLNIAIDWRQENDIENIMYQPFPRSIEQEYPFVLDGSVDKMGRPIFQAMVGHFNLRKTTIARQEHVLIRYIALMLEMIDRQIYYGRLVQGHANLTQAVMIADLQGYNLVSTGCWKCLTLIPDLVPILESYYPGLFYRIYFINTPGIFDTMLKIVKSLMRQETKEALEIYDSEKTAWTRALLAEIAPDQLSWKYGGTQRHPKPLIKQKLIEYVELEREGKLPEHGANDVVHHHHEPESAQEQATEQEHRDSEHREEKDEFPDINFDDATTEKHENHENHEPHHHYTHNRTISDTNHVPNSLLGPVIDSEKGQIHPHVTDSESDSTNEGMELSTLKPAARQNFTRRPYYTSHNRTKQIYRDVRVPAKKGSSARSNPSYPFPTALMGLGAIVSRMLCC